MRFYLLVATAIIFFAIFFQLCPETPTPEASVTPEESSTPVPSKTPEPSATPAPPTATEITPTSPPEITATASPTLNISPTSTLPEDKGKNPTKTYVPTSTALPQTGIFSADDSVQGQQFDLRILAAIGITLAVMIVFLAVRRMRS